MRIRSQQQQLGARGVSTNVKTSWAAQEHDSTLPNLETMARFQQKQLQEKEQKLLQLYDQQQQRAYQVVQRSSAGSNSSNHSSTTVRTATTMTTTTSTSQGGKVRQMFDERRQTVKGIDRSYPLEPLENKLRKQANTNGVATQRNGNVTVNRQSVKRVSRADVNSNVNNGKPVVSYHEEIIRESFGPSVRRHDDEDEYGVENRVATFANGHYRHEADNEQEEMLDQDMIESNRMMAKIHLMGFDETLKHRVRNDLESEEFPEYLMVDVPDKLSKKNVTKKLSQAEERLERFKNANAKRSNMPKQSTSSNTVIRKRSEQVIPTKSNSRIWGGTSPTSVRSGSSRTSERSQILENAKSPLPTRTRVVDEMNTRRRENLDTETLDQHMRREATKAEITSRIYAKSNEFKSLTSDGKIFVRRSASPQFYCRESERSGTTMSIDRKSDSSRSPLFHRETLTKRSKSPRFFLNESRRTSESKSSVWDDRGISSRQSQNPQYFYHESKRSDTAMSTDRETIGSKSSEWNKGTKQDVADFKRKKIQTNTSLGRQFSPSKSSLYEEKILKKRSTSPQFFCKESERSATTVSIDRATSESKSQLYNGEIVTKRSENPPFFLSESEQSHRTRESKSSMWDDRETSSRQNMSLQYLRHKPKQPNTTMSTNQETIGSKLSEWNKGTKRDITDFERKKVQTNTSLDRQSSPSKSSLYEEKILKKRSTSPQFFCKESERSATTMSIDRATSESKSPSYDREILMKRSESPPFFLNESEQSRRTSESKSSIWDNKEMLSRQNMNSQYRYKPKQFDTAMRTDRKTIGSKSSDWNKKTKQDVTDFERKKVQTSTSLGRQSFPFKSPHEEKILKKRSTSPQFFCKESERSATVTIDRATSESKSQLYNGEIVMKRNESPPCFLSESKQSRSISESKSPVWDDRGILSRQSMSSQYLHHKSKQSDTAMSTERKTIGSKSSEWSKGTKQNVTDFERKKVQTSTSLGRQSSPFKSPHEEKIFKKRSTSPQFFCKESERSATVSIDRATSESKSQLYNGEIVMKRNESPPCFLSESKQSRSISESKSPVWDDRGILSRQSMSSQYLHHKSKQSDTAMSTERKTIGSKSSEWSKGTKQNVTDFERKKVQTSTNLGQQSSPSKSSLYEQEISKRRSTSPQFFCKESEQFATTMSIDRAINKSKSRSYDDKIVTKRSKSPPYFLSESEQSRRTSESKSIWDNKGILSRQNMNSQYLHHKPKQFDTATSTDRKTIGSKSSEWNKKTKRDMTDFKRKKVQTSTSLGRQSSPFKSPLYEEKILKKRSTSPQFFCKESERSATTMSIDRATIESKSPSYDREILITNQSENPSFFLSESEQSHRTSEFKSPIWDDRILSRQSLSPQYSHRESKRTETAMSTDRETVEFKSSERSKQNTSPRFFCRESERSGTTMSIDRKVGEPRSSSYNQKILTKRSVTPRFLNKKTEQRSATTTNINQKYSGYKSPGITRDKRFTSPQFFCKESKKSATTMLIEPRLRSDSIKNELKQRSYVSDTSYKRPVKSPIDKKISSTKDRRTPSPSVTKHEEKKASKKTEVSSSITETRRSSKTSETSTSSIVNLKYGLEFDNIFQSTGLVRKFMKSQDGKQRTTRQSPSKRNNRDVNARISARGNQSKNHKTSPPLQTARSPSIKGGKRTMLEFSRKSITPIEVDMDIQEITMTDHRIERDKLQKASSPILKRQFDGTSSSGAKFKTSITYPVRKTHGQRESILKSSIFMSKGGLSEKKFIDHQSDRESEESVISLNKLGFSPTSESSRRITRDREGKTKMSSQTRKQSARHQAKYIATQFTKREDRQRASSRSPNQMRNRSAKNRTDSPKATSPVCSKVRKYPDAVSPILDFAERTKGARTKFDQPQSLRSARLVQGVVKDRNLSTDDEYQEKGEDKEETKNMAVDEVDAGISVKYQTVVKTALNEENKDYRPNFDRVTNKRVFLQTIQKPMKSNVSKKISPMRECGRWHDVKSRVSPLRKTAEISRGTYPKIFSSQSIVSRADQSSTSKFSTYTVRDRKHESVLAKKLAESFDKMCVKRKTEEPGDDVREFSKVQREDKYEKDLERMDSVESALKRFDSIGAEFERSSPTSIRASSEISLQSMDIQRKASIKESIGSEETTIPSCVVTDRTILKTMLKSPVDKDLKAKNAERKNDLRIFQKETRSSRGSSRVGSSIESKQRSTKIRSPMCKRRLFESDSKKEIQEERPKSSCAKVRKDENCSFVNLRFREDEVSNVKSSKSLDRDVTKESMMWEETPTFFVKPLRSIEDIRKSIDNERNKLVATEESRSAIANRRSTSREGVDAKRSSPVTDAARNVFLGADPARMTKIKSCVSRITKSPSPDSAVTKQRETNTRTIRRSAPSSPSKSPDVASRRAESRNQEVKSSRRSTKGTDSIGSKATVTGTVDTADDIVLQNGLPNESTTRKSDASVIDFDDRSSKEDDATPSKKSMKKSSNDKQQTASSASGRPTSSNSSVNLIQESSAKSRMTESERGKGIGKGGGKSRGKGIEKPSSSSGKLANTSSFNEDATIDAKGLIKCKTCGRSFAQNRIDLHEEICVKTMTKKRKQFDPVMCRVKGTELEPFVKKSLAKREMKTKKPEIKPDWRRKHEEFINAIRYARETQARLAAGGNLSDLPPPPPSDTSDYVQCEHCGRKFNRSAAERHIPICKRMHDKKQTQAPRARR